MEKRKAYFVSRKNVLTWLSVLLVFCSAVVRLILHCEKGTTSGSAMALQILLPVFAEFLFILIVIFNGKEWLYRTAAGIRTVEAAPGFTHVVFCPIPEKRLGFVEASINTKHGEIRSAWYLQGDSVRYELVVPHGVSATVRLPGVPERTVDAGSWQFIAPYVPQGKL